jgi:hypothetical protein
VHIAKGIVNLNDGLQSHWFADLGERVVNLSGGRLQLWGESRRAGWVAQSSDPANSMHARGRVVRSARHTFGAVASCDEQPGPSDGC